MLRFAIIIISIICTVQGYQHFQAQIPNGERIPQPCGSDDLWRGVGHENPSGGGTRNPFGLDFAKNDFVWDECLCRHDSDNDGRTNGEELGDPDCEWIPGMEPSRTYDLSHPGVCEPVNSAECSAINGWLDCNALIPFHCPAFDAPDTNYVDLQIPPHPIPEKETTYMCTALDFPTYVTERNLHMIGAEAYVDNVALMHHVIVYGCIDDVHDQVIDLFGNTAECGNMVTQLCDQVISVWGLALVPDCYPEDFGIRLGIEGFKTLVMEFHYNNPQNLRNEMDSSGVRFYYTPNMRQFDAETIYFGPVYLELPPLQSEVVQEGLCPSECTSRMFSETVYISSILPHMHLAGKGMKVEHIRNGEVIRVLVNYMEYDYNSPKRNMFNPAIEIQPGDEIHTTCTFDTSNREEFTFFGQATSDEMCLAITQYYPVQANGGDCIALDNNTVGRCNRSPWGVQHLGDCTELVRNEEALEIYVENEYGPFLDMLKENCDVTGLECYDGCGDVIDYITSQRCQGEETDAWFKRSVAQLIDRRDLLPTKNNSKIFRLTMASCSYSITNDTPKDKEGSTTLPYGQCPFGGDSNDVTYGPMPDSASRNLVLVNHLIVMVVSGFIVLFCVFRY